MGMGCNHRRDSKYFRLPVSTIDHQRKSSAGAKRRALPDYYKGSSAEAVATKTAHAGAFFSAIIKSSGYVTPALTESGILPAGLTFTDNGNSTATLAGTPAIGSGGAYPITVTAMNSFRVIQPDFYVESR